VPSRLTKWTRRCKSWAEATRSAVHTFFAAVRSRWDLALENLVLRHRLQVALRTNLHPRLRARDRVLWVWLRHLWSGGWRRHLRVVMLVDNTTNGLYRQSMGGIRSAQTGGGYKCADA